MKKVISLTLTLAMVLSLIVPIGAVGSTTPNTLKWDAKYTNALIIEAERNITRKNADGDKITSNTNNEDFEGLYFYWNDKQKDNGFLLVTPTVFNLFVGEQFTITAKNANNYWNYNIIKDSKYLIDGVYTYGIPKQIKYNEDQNNGKISANTEDLKNINMIFIEGNYKDATLVIEKKWLDTDKKNINGNDNLVSFTSGYILGNNTVKVSSWNHKISFAENAIDGYTLTSVLINGKPTMFDIKGNVSFNIKATEKITAVFENQKVQTSTVGKEKLEEYITEAVEFNKYNYTNKSWNVFVDAIENGKEVFNDPNATDEKIETAIEKIEEAIFNLVLKDSIEGKGKLEDLFFDTEYFDKSNYTQVSWNKLADAIENGKEVFDNPDATDEEIDTAIDEIEEAINELVPKNNIDNNYDNLYAITDIIRIGSLSGLAFEVSASDACCLDIIVLSDVTEDIITGRSTNWISGNFITSGQTFINEKIEMELVNIECTSVLPLYFIVIANLLDNEGNRLCEQAVFIEFTDSFNQFMKQTIYDFDPKSVINLDNDPANNFLVVNQNVLIIRAGENDQNFLTVINENEYYLKNASSEVLSLPLGSKLVVITGDGEYIYPIHVSQINIDNSNVAINDENEYVLADFFDIVKLIITDYEPGKIILDMSETDEGVEYLEDITELVNIESELMNNNHGTTDEFGIMALSEIIDINPSVSYDCAFKINVPLPEKSPVEISGTLGYKFKITVRILYDAHFFSKDYFEFKFTTSTEETKSMSLKLKAPIPDYEEGIEMNVAKITIPFLSVPGLKVTDKIKMCLKWDISTNVSINSKTVTEKGFKYTTTGGWQDVDKKEYIASYNAAGEYKLTAGPKNSFALEYSVVGTGASAGVEIYAGLEFKATITASQDVKNNATSIHNCDVCVDGVITKFLKASLYLDAQICYIQFGKIIDITLAEFRGQLCVFYISLLNDLDSVFNGQITKGLGTCPNKVYRVRFYPKDDNGNIVSNAVVTVKNRITGAIINTGIGAFTKYMYNGDYVATATSGGAEYGDAYFRVWNDKVDVTISELTSSGIFKGDVKDAENRKPIQGASIKVYKGTTSIASRQTGNNGNYELPLAAGAYNVLISAAEYKTVTAYVTIEQDRTHYMETLLMVYNIAGNGTVTGIIKDALTNTVLSDVTLSIREGWGNINMGTVVATVVTNYNGQYNLTLPYGNYTVSASKNGYITDSFNIVSTMTASQKNSTLTPIMSDDVYRIVLTWGSTPRDLDAHLVANAAHVYYSYRYSEYAWLDVDVTSSYGPETIAINNLVLLGSYIYCIHDYTNRSYSGSYELSNSNAIVRVYKGSQLIKTYNVPTGREGTVWNVFKMDANGKITDLNTFENQYYPGLIGSSSLMAFSSFLFEEMKDYEFLEQTN